MSDYQSKHEQFYSQEPQMAQATMSGVQWRIPFWFFAQFPFIEISSTTKTYNLESKYYGLFVFKKISYISENGIALFREEFEDFVPKAPAMSSNLASYLAFS